MSKRLIKNILLVFVIASYCRLVFTLNNLSYFSELNISTFFYGLRFDLVSIAYLFSAFFIFSLIPFKNQENRWKRRLMIIFFQIGLNITLLSNFIDTIYYNFTFKRSTGDIFNLINTGNEFTRLIPQFLKDYWLIVVVYIFSVYLFTFLYNKLNKIGSPLFLNGFKSWTTQFLGLILGIGILIVAARGGTQLRPLNMADAPRYAKGAEVAVLVNTPFSILLTFQKPGVERITYLTQEELQTLYNPEIKLNGIGGYKGRNIVVIILESFAEEYIGQISKKTTYTPFLDSLIKESYVFQNNRANGLKSIEALPSIFSGLPSLNNTSFILSPYASSRLNSLPELLNKKGYQTSFFHAGETGTMAFDAYCKNAGVDNYYGLEDYPNKKEDYDGYWGIYDEPYLQYFSKELNKMKQPFFSSLFTLSSHHPYSIPKKHLNRFKKGTLKVHETIGYTDYALKQFFNTAKKEKWFKNTLFVLTADHPAQSEYKYYKINAGRFKVPLVFYDPNGNLKGSSNKTSKHADIPSTILSLLGDSSTFVSFGQDLFAPEENIVVNYRNNQYLIRNNHFSMVFNGEIATQLYSAKDSLWRYNLADSIEFKTAKDTLLLLGKAYIQQYNNRLIENKLYIE
tara:strand:- start:890 stop:2761 length:1872 start_codon:yes stop_codon:yes gene_type:complete